MSYYRQSGASVAALFECPKLVHSSMPQSRQPSPYMDASLLQGINNPVRHITTREVSGNKCLHILWEALLCDGGSDLRSQALGVSDVVVAHQHGCMRDALCHQVVQECPAVFLACHAATLLVQRPAKSTSAFSSNIDRQTGESRTCGEHMVRYQAAHLRSSAYSSPLSFSTPDGTRATPKRAVLVGNTLSNMSAPSAACTETPLDGHDPGKCNGGTLLQPSCPTCTTHGRAAHRSRLQCQAGTQSP